MISAYTVKKISIKFGRRNRAVEVKTIGYKRREIGYSEGSQVGEPLSMNQRSIDRNRDEI